MIFFSFVCRAHKRAISISCNRLCVWMVHTQISCTGGDKRGRWSLGFFDEVRQETFKTGNEKQLSIKVIQLLLFRQCAGNTDWLQTLGQINCFNKRSRLSAFGPSYCPNCHICICGRFFVRDPFFPSFNMLLPIYASSYTAQTVLYTHLCMYQLYSKLNHCNYVDKNHTHIAYLTNHVIVLWHQARN